MLSLSRRHRRLRRRAGRRRRAPSTCPTARCSPCSGPSGCGKSTLLRAIAGLEPTAAGTVALGRPRPGRVPTHRRGFALMFQDGQLFAHLTVARNVGYALRLRRCRRHRRPGRRAARAGRARGVRRPAARRPSPAASGSGSRWPARWRVEPRLLLLDEPLSALDAGLRERLAGDLRDDPARGRHHRADGHPRPRGGVRGRRPARGDAGRAGRAAGRHRRGVARAGRRRRPRSSSATPACCGGEAAARGAGGRRAADRRRRSPYAARRWSSIEDGPLAGAVVSARATPEQVRLECRRRRGRARWTPSRRSTAIPGPGSGCGWRSTRPGWRLSRRRR